MREYPKVAQFISGCIHVLALGFCLSFVITASVNSQAPDTAAQRPYSMEEYNLYAMAIRASDYHQRIASLDAFVSKYPDSPLLIYANSQYCDAYRNLGDVKNAMEYSEKVFSYQVNDKRDANMRFEAVLVWLSAYKETHSADKALSIKAMATTRLGLDLLTSIEKSNAGDKVIEEEARKARIYINTMAASAATALKDYGAANEALAAVAALSSFDPARLRPRSLPSL